MQQLKNGLEKYIPVKMKLRNTKLTRRLLEDGIDLLCDPFCSHWLLPFITSERKDMYNNVLILVFPPTHLSTLPTGHIKTG